MKNTEPKPNETPRDIVSWIRENVPAWEETTTEAERVLILVADRLEAALNREAKKLEHPQNGNFVSVDSVRRTANNINL